VRFEWIPFDQDNNGRFACGQALAWLLFLATAVHLAFLVPSPNALMPGERAKVFSGFLCAMSLLLAILFGKKGTIRPRSPELWISLTLLMLMVLSTIFSTDPRSSIPRAFVVSSAGFGGFWCARLLLYNRRRTEIFLDVCLFLFTAILVAGTIGILFFDNVVHLIDTNWHTVGGRIFLLSFAPIALCTTGTGAKRAFGVLLLVFGYGVLLFSGRAAGAGANVLIPAAMCGMALVLRKWRLKHGVVLILLLVLLCGGVAWHLAAHCGHIDKSHQSIAYRVESLFFSWHIATQHWMLGNGLWSPRDPYLDDYSLSYPHLTRETFTEWTRHLRVSENNFLTFMADLGFPFVLIYTGVLLFFLGKMLSLHYGKRNTLPFPPIVLLLPVAGEVLHLLVYDGLFHPQSSWYLHVLLGLVPLGAPSEQDMA
jgi:hypothetical protein